MLIIYSDGNLVPSNTWWRSEGPIFHDKDSPYRNDFYIALPYSPEQKKQYARLVELKNNLTATDYQPSKYIEGEYTEEEWEEKKAQRAAWRNEIREIEKDFVDPSISLEEMREAERKAMEHIGG